MILKNHTNTFVRKERLSPARKARTEASRKKFVKKSGIPDKVKSFRKVYSCKNRPRPGLGLLNSSEMD